MVLINKKEKDAIVKRFPNVHIVRTMKQKSKRHRYYCEEKISVMRFLERMRNPDKDMSQRRDWYNADRAKNRRKQTRLS